MPHAHAESKQSSSSSKNDTEKRGENPSPTSSSTRGQGPLHATAPTVVLNADERSTQDVRGTQQKLTVNEPDDRYERGAERVAEQVMRMSATESQLNPRVAAGITRNESSDGSAIDGEMEKQIRSVMSGGRPLPPAVRSFFELRFDRNFNDVRIHTGSKADEVARSIDAKAFTIGRDVVFAHNNYQPSTRQGKRLLAHELSHVVQPSDGATRIQRQEDGSETQPWPGDFRGTTPGREVDEEKKTAVKQRLKNHINAKVNQGRDTLVGELKTAAETFENWYTMQTLPEAKPNEAVLRKLVSIAYGYAKDAIPVGGEVIKAVEKVHSLLDTYDKEIEKALKAEKSKVATILEQKILNKADDINDTLEGLDEEIQSERPKVFKEMMNWMDLGEEYQVDYILEQRLGVPVNIPDNLSSRTFEDMVFEFKEWKRRRELQRSFPNAMMEFWPGPASAEGVTADPTRRNRREAEKAREEMTGE